MSDKALLRIKDADYMYFEVNGTFYFTIIFSLSLSLSLSYYNAGTMHCKNNW